MSSIRPSVVGALITGLVAGTIAGIFIGRTRASTPPSPPKTAQKEPNVPRSVLPATEFREVPEDPAVLKELVVRQRAEIETLKAQVENSNRGGGAEPRTTDRVALAKEIYEALVGAMEEKDPGKMLKNLSRIDELDETAAPFLIEQYRKTSGDMRGLALSMAVACGGRTVADFLKELLHNPGPSADERKALFEALELDDGTFFTPKPLPVDPELTQVALSLASSPIAEERNGGIGLLGRQEDPASRARLQQMAVSDPDKSVRSRALDALGHVGDRATLSYLQSLPAPDDSYLAASLRDAVDKLKKRFPD